LKALEYVMKNDPDKEFRKAAYDASVKIRYSREILEEEPTHKISVGGDILIDSEKINIASCKSSSTKQNIHSKFIEFIRSLLKRAHLRSYLQTFIL